MQLEVPHPLHLFPRRPRLSHSWGDKRILNWRCHAKDWLTCAGGTEFERDTAGLCTFDELRLNFRRVEGGGIFTNPGDERSAAARASQIFECWPGSNSKAYAPTDTAFLIVPKHTFRELLSIEAKLRDERVSLASRCRKTTQLIEPCLGGATTSLAVPSIAGTMALISLCNETMHRCELALNKLNKASQKKRNLEYCNHPWASSSAVKLVRARRGVCSNGRRSVSTRSTTSLFSIREQILDAEIKTARLALRTGEWHAYRKKKIYQAMMLECQQMAIEDAFISILDRWKWAEEQRIDYRLYCSLVAQFGVPFSDHEFIHLGTKAGRTFAARCDRGARSFQQMWRSRAPKYRLRRSHAATIIQAAVRGYSTRRRWKPVMCLRIKCDVMGPRKRTFAQWKVCIARTVRARDLMRRIKFGEAKAILREWRKVVDEIASQTAVSTALDNVVDALIDLYAETAFEEWLDSVDAQTNVAALEATDLLFDALTSDWIWEELTSMIARDRPNWMDVAWFLRHGTYEVHVALAKAGVLPESLFAVERTRFLELKAATILQRRARGYISREHLRPRIASMYRKKWNETASAHYYLNVKTFETKPGRPALVNRLFPHSNF